MSYCRVATSTYLFMVSSVFIAACGDDVANPQNENEQEVITTVTLSFTPTNGGTAIEASFDDPDGEGGAAPTTDAITLTAGSTYTVTLQFLNKLEDPPEDITEEIEEENDQHQIFFTGGAVDSPATTNSNAILEQSYTDMDAYGLPVGLTNTIVARSVGTATLTVTLRHLPPIDGNRVKVASLASEVASGGIGSIAGETDATVDFDVTVQ